MKRIKGLRINHINTSNYFEPDEFNDPIIEEFEFIYEEDGQLFSEKMVLQQGECYSGYCGAEWIISQGKKINNIGTLHYVPKEPIEVESIKTDYDGNGAWIAYENDCHYYPSADLRIIFDAWIDTRRGKDKKQIYVFIGPSAIGKSFLAHHTDLKVFETDSNGLIGLDNTYDVIVVGNRYPMDLDTLKHVLSDVELIKVKFEEFL